MTVRSNKSIWLLANWLYIHAPLPAEPWDGTEDQWYDMAVDLLKLQANNEFTGEDDHD